MGMLLNFINFFLSVAIEYSDLQFNQKTKKFEINFDDLESKLADPYVKIFINCKFVDSVFDAFF
jgi:hypothetical protein